MIARAAREKRTRARAAEGDQIEPGLHKEGNTTYLRVSFVPSK